MFNMVETLKLLIYACQVTYGVGPGSNYEFILARQASCQRLLVKCIKEQAELNLGVYTDYNTMLCLTGDEPRLEPVVSTPRSQAIVPIVPQPKQAEPRRKWLK